jgi:hypothetical protein
VSAPTPEIRAFQIFYDEKTRASLDRDFEPLDNTDSERADWYEYWPIRNWLSRNELNESSYYGFLSPRFGEKTRLSGAQVKEFVRTAGDPDVVTFSPVPCHAACFLNVFEHGDFFHRGLFEVATRFFEKVDPLVKLDTLVMDSRNTVFSNFFLAKRAFWEVWKVVFDRLFEMAESPGFPLHDSLNRELEYAKDNGETSSTHMKIFVMERAASFVLASGKFRVRNFPPFQIPVCYVFSGRLADIVALDSLKIAYSETEEPDYLMLYMQMRDEALASTWLKSAGSKGALAQSRG